MSSNHRGHNRGEVTVDSAYHGDLCFIEMGGPIRYIREILAGAEATARQMYQANVLV